MTKENASEMDIRRANFRALNKSPSQLVKDLGSSPSYWSELLNESSKKAFGEKTARRVESGYGLPKGWLDRNINESTAGPELKVSGEIELTAQVVELMAIKLREAASEMDRLAGEMRSSEDLGVAADAVSVIAHLIPSLRLDLLVTRPQRAMRLRKKL